MFDKWDISTQNASNITKLTNKKRFIPFFMCCCQFHTDHLYCDDQEVLSLKTLLADSSVRGKILGGLYNLFFWNQYESSALMDQSCTNNDS